MDYELDRYGVWTPGLNSVAEAAATSEGLSDPGGYGLHFENDTFEMRPYYWGGCTCGFETLEWEWDKNNPGDEDGRAYVKWRETHGHSTDCLEILPNFRHKPSGLAISWYKYIGRGMETNQKVSDTEALRIILECLRSIEEEK